MKKFLYIAFGLISFHAAYGQTVNPNQIRPSTTPNQCLVTVAGVTTWASCTGASGITALTGDVTATGPGSVPATLATVNGSPGTCGDATHVCAITTNGKGLTTGQTSTAITFPAVTVPASPSASIQYNNAGAFGGSSNATLDSIGNLNALGQLGIGLSRANTSHVVDSSGSSSSTTLNGANPVELRVANTDTTANNYEGVVGAMTNSTPAVVTAGKMTWVNTSHTAAAESADLHFLNRNAGIVTDWWTATHDGIFGATAGGWNITSGGAGTFKNAGAGGTSVFINPDSTDAFGSSGLGNANVGYTQYINLTSGTLKVQAPTGVALGTKTDILPVPVSSSATLCASDGTGGGDCAAGPSVSDPLPRWRAALNNVAKGTGNARVIGCQGDSHCFGFNSSLAGNMVATSPFAQMCQYLMGSVGAGYGVPCAWGSWFGGGAAATNGFGYNDARIARGSFLYDASFPSIGYAGYSATSNASGPFAFTPTQSTDTFRIFYTTGPGLGTLGYNLNGGSTTTINTSAGSVGCAVQTVTGTLGANTLNLLWSSGGKVIINGTESYNSTISQVIMELAGANSATSTQLSDTTNSCGPGNAAIYSLIGPALTIGDWGIANDWLTSVSPSTTQTNVQTIVTALGSASSDVAFMAPPSSATGSATQATQTATVAAEKAVRAVTFNSTSNIAAPFIDIYDAWTNYLTVTTNGNSYMSDSLHPNTYGYQQESQLFLNGLVASPGQPFTGNLGLHEFPYIGIGTLPVSNIPIKILFNQAGGNGAINSTNSNSAGCSQINQFADVYQFNIGICGSTIGTFANKFVIYDAVAVAAALTIDPVNTDAAIFRGTVQTPSLGVGVAAPATAGTAQVNVGVGIGTAPSSTIPLKMAYNQSGGNGAISFTNSNTAGCSQVDEIANVYQFNVGICGSTIGGGLANQFTIYDTVANVAALDIDPTNSDAATFHGALTATAITGSTSVKVAGGTAMTGNLGNGTSVVHSTATSATSGHIATFDANSNIIDGGAVPTSGLSGMTTGQVAIAGSATTITSSKALAGSGAGVTTGPTSSVSGDIATFTGVAGQIADGGANVHQMYSDIQGVLFSTSTMLGPVFYEPAAGTMQILMARLSGTISCAVAPVVQLLDLGTSPTTVFASGVAISNLTTGTSDGVYTTGTGLGVAVTAGHYYGFAFSTGTCVTAPAFDLTAQIQ